MLSLFDLLFASFASKVQLMLTYVWFKFVSRGKKRDEDHQAGVQMGPEVPEKPWHGPGGSEEVNGQSDFVCRPIYWR